MTSGLKLSCSQFSEPHQPVSSSCIDQQTTLHTFPRQRRLVDSHMMSSFLPPPPPPHCDEFSSHSMNKSDRRKTVTFLGDVETIHCDENNSSSSDFFPLPPPLLPMLLDSDASISVGERQSGEENKSSSTNSPDYVESSV